jgi:hypothetical protein
LSVEIAFFHSYYTLLKNHSQPWCSARLNVYIYGELKIVLSSKIVIHKDDMHKLYYKQKNFKYIYSLVFWWNPIPNPFAWYFHAEFVHALMEQDFGETRYEKSPVFPGFLPFRPKDVRWTYQRYSLWYIPSLVGLPRMGDTEAMWLGRSAIYFVKWEKF